jgi:hypothetical protein
MVELSFAFVILGPSELFDLVGSGQERAMS